MAIPNLLHEVEAGRQRWPHDWADAHTGNANTEGFIRKLAAHCHQSDPRVGLNGKRGNPNDISDDVLAFRGEGSAIDAVNGGPMEIVDIIGGAGGPNPQPAWNVGPGGPGDRGTWVQPDAVSPVPVPTPTPGAGWEAKHDTLLRQMAAFSVEFVAEQFAFSFPGEGWGRKRADVNRPISGDVMARQGARLVGYRIVPRPTLSPPAIALDGQVFVPVTPRNHLGAPSPVPVPNPTPNPVPGGMPSYEAIGGDAAFDKAAAVLFADYARRPEAPNPGMGRWLGRLAYRQITGETADQALAHVRPEWLAALGISA